MSYSTHNSTPTVQKYMHSLWIYMLCNNSKLKKMAAHVDIPMDINIHSR